MCTYINSERLVFRPITNDDTDSVLKWRNSDHVKHNFLYRKDITREEHLKWLNERVRSGEVIQFVIVEKDTGNDIGSVYFKDINGIDHSAEYGIFIGEKSALGRGYGSETAKRMVDWFFEEMNYNSIHLHVLSHNIPAIRSYEAVGFKINTHKSQIKIIDNKKEKILFMSIYREDYLTEKG